ncbi:MAG TPA: hypothetical protein VGO04_10285 [Ensifer sp.]|uniref:hypothetical protein n=1 Tax=Ensifer sp. TaxID=1872086 RepID=UPI002E1436B8|nr:hypothetical protein [Ensifer sp.]
MSIYGSGCRMLRMTTVGQMFYRAPRLIVRQERVTGAIVLGLGFRLLFSGGAGASAVRS